MVPSLLIIRTYSIIICLLPETGYQKYMRSRLKSHTGRELIFKQMKTVFVTQELKNNSGL